MCCEVFDSLKKLLKQDGHITSVGDEGGFAPNLGSTENALRYLQKAIEMIGYKLGLDFKLALDVAASSFYDKETERYIVKDPGLNESGLSQAQMIDYYKSFIDRYDIISIEDGLDEQAYTGWTDLTQELGPDLNIVGDDLFVTNKDLLSNGIKNKMANTILIKPNQIGTVSETLQTIALAKANNYKYIISHRSGESEDTFIAHLAVGSGSGFIKTGSVCRGERTCKYNELIRIEDDGIN